MKIEKLSGTLQKIIAARGLAGRLGIYRVLGQWEGMVGDVISRHVQPLSLRGKSLSVQVDSAVWMQQLSLLKPEILEKVNKGLGQPPLKDIVLNLGEIRPPEQISFSSRSRRASMPRIERIAAEVLTRMCGRRCGGGWRRVF